MAALAVCICELMPLIESTVKSDLLGLGVRIRVGDIICKARA